MNITRNLIGAFPTCAHHFRGDCNFLRSLAEEFAMQYKEVDIPEVNNGWLYGLGYVDKIINPSGKYHIRYEGEYFSCSIFISMFEITGGWDISLPITPPKEFAQIEELKQGIISPDLWTFLDCIYGEDWPGKIHISIYFAGKDGKITDIPVVFKKKLP